MKSDLFSRFLVGVYAIASVLSILKTAEGYTLNNYDYELLNLTRVPRQVKECNGFKCQTTNECIPEEKKCDGTVDCQDGSDEFDTCKQLGCPGFLFTCDYGACIEKEKKCDGKKDCRDNSDEANCVVNSGSNKISSNCKSDQFECKSGQCISLDDKCSGVPECEDRSDETKETCFNVFCPGYTFKCDYGACASGFARCNGVKDCVDNSDEENCDPKVLPTPLPTPKPTVQPSVPGVGNCILPHHPQFGKWSVVGGQNLNPQEYVSPNTVLQFNCNEGYKLSTESAFALCHNGNWGVDNWPTCLKKCQPLYGTKITNIKCVNSNGVEVKCQEATNGTSATFTCAPYYEPVDQRKVTRFCWGGTWNLEPPRCQPVCGEKKVSAVPLIVNGKEVKQGNYPWVTALYRKDIPSSTLEYTNVCAGSVLTQRVILTAAHCVTNESSDLIDKENIMIGVGKYYNKYQDERDTEAQYSKIEKIIVAPFYKGDKQRYSSDIALLITKEELLLSKVVQPVCYQDLTSIHLNSQSIGVITGWGYTVASGSPSDVLLEIDVPYKDQGQCSAEIPKDFIEKYYTYDKMCAGHYNRSISVCRGDSGGGLVYINRRDSRYYVHGIVSITDRVRDGCDIEVSALYTRVASHYDWLEKMTSQYGTTDNT